MVNRFLNRLKRKRLRYEKTGNMTPIHPITGADIGPKKQDHHIAGKDYHDDTIPLNPDGHHAVNDAFRDLPMPIPGPVRERERMARYLLGYVIIQDFALDRIWEFAENTIAEERAAANRELAAADVKKKPARQTRTKKRGKSD